MKEVVEMADYKMETVNKNKGRTNWKKVKSQKYAYGDVTNIQIIVSLVMWAVMAFIIVTKLFFTNVAEMKLLRYIAYASFLVLTIIYIVKMAEKKDLKAYWLEDETKNRFTNMFFALAIIGFFSFIVEIGIFGHIISGLVGWFLIIKPTIRQYTVDEEECNQISVVFILLIVTVTAAQIAGLGSGEEAGSGASWLWFLLRR